MFGIALLSRQGGPVLELGLSIASVSYGCLLGVFLLGVLTRRANQTGTLIGMAVGLAANIYLWKNPAVQWTWYVVFGALITFAVGYVMSLFVGKQMEAQRA